MEHYVALTLNIGLLHVLDVIPPLYSTNSSLLSSFYSTDVGLVQVEFKEISVLVTLS
jgi:hypothetical protein